MKKHILLLTATTLLALGGCSNSSDKADEGESQIQRQQTSNPAPSPDGANTMNSVDWAGSYTGTLPCADCEGIETTLILKNDRTFSLETKYLGKDDQPVQKLVGAFKWDDSGSIITLEEVENQPGKFKVGENKVWHLDTEGNEITGELADKYVLTKSL